jgi:hypothetical protein
MYKMSVSELPPENELTHNPSITKYLPVSMPLPSFEPNLCLNEKGGKFQYKNWVSYDAAT